MLKNLINLVFLAPNFIASPILNSFQNTSSNLNLINYIDESILIENINKNVEHNIENGDKNFWGPNKDTRYRIYIDSSGDSYLPELKEDTNDYIIKGKKDTWYNHLINGLSIDVTDFANDKYDFLKNHKTITFTYSYNFNFWNSKKDWSKQYGKHIPLLFDSRTFDLTPANNEISLFYENDSNHSNNESARLIVKQEWNGNLLTYNFYLGVSYHWKALSSINHASFAVFAGDYYSFASIDESENNSQIKIEEINTKSSFILDSYPQEISFVDFDKEIKHQAKKSNIVESPFKRSVIFVQGYQGIKRVGNTIYTRSVCMIWNSSINYDSTLILNNNVLDRKITTEYKNENFNFLYENSTGLKQSIKLDKDDVEILGMEMIGNFHLSFIYA